MTSVRPATALQDGVTDQLGREIVSGGVACGHRYTLDGLQERFGISRTVARDVMRVLDSLGLVTPRRSVGLVVNHPDRWNVHSQQVIRWRLEGPERDQQFKELTQLRIAIEPFAAAETARHAPQHVRDRMLELAGTLRRLGEAGDLEAFLQADIEFHALLLKHSGNSMFASLDGVIGEVLAGRTHSGLMPFHPREEALNAHEDLARAIAAGDPAGAEAGALSIVTEVRQALEADLPTLG